MKSLVINVLLIILVIGLTCCKKEERVNEPTLNTLAVIEVLSTSAKSGGNIADDGGASIISRGLVWGLSTGPSLQQHAGLTAEGSGIGIYTSTLTNLSPGTNYFVRAYATNKAGIGYGNELQFTTTSIGTVTTTTITGLTPASVSIGGTVTEDGGAPVTAKGVCWSSNQNPTISNNYTIDGSGLGSFKSTVYGLSANTTYYVRAYATNSAGTAYGSQVTFTTLNTGEVYNPVTGRIWMDRNLGASRVATSFTDEQAFGYLYQWGRGSDGHQIRTSGTTNTLSNSDTPGHANFILVSGAPYNWRSPPNSKLWQGVYGINNPCPVGFRLPTEAEWTAEVSSWGTSLADGAFDSPLKLTLAGFRSENGDLSWVGLAGLYWSSTTYNPSFNYAVQLRLFPGETVEIYEKISLHHGQSVRCIKD